MRAANQAGLLGPITPWNVVPKTRRTIWPAHRRALVSPQGTDESQHGTVTIFNTSPTLSLRAGLLDTHDHEEPLSGTIRPSHALTGIVLKGRRAKLANIGGTITLLDAAGSRWTAPYDRNAGRRRRAFPCSDAAAAALMIQPHLAKIGRAFSDCKT